MKLSDAYPVCKNSMDFKKLFSNFGTDDIIKGNGQLILSFAVSNTTTDFEDGELKKPLN